MINRDYWYIAAVTMLLLSLTVGSYTYWYAFNKTFSWGSLVMVAYSYGALIYGPLIGAACGLISYIKNGRKDKSLTIVILCIVATATSYTYFWIDAKQERQKTQARLEARSPTQKLYDLAARNDFLQPTVKKEFIELLKRGADINSKGKYGYSSSVLGGSLVYNSNPKIIDFYLEHGADINIQDNDGKSPLYIAADMGKVELVKRLLERGANTELVTYFGRTALSVAEFRLDEMTKGPETEFNEKQLARYKPIVSLLKLYGERDKIQNDSNQTPNKREKKDAQNSSSALP